ncbi:MAG: hypothetical protein ACI8TX_003572 [Hyphomicrobiaceae bacterium]|jgi:hypothetical protein
MSETIVTVGLLIVSLISLLPVFGILLLVGDSRG